MLRKTIILPLAALVGASLLAGCASTGLGDNLGTTVSASDMTVSLQWVPEHPLDAQLRSRPLMLVAEYQTGSDEAWVREVVGKGAGINSRSVDFRLPTVLKAVPSGSVCLFVEISGRTRLPVRPTSRGEDATRFTYPAWVGYVRASSAILVEVNDRERQRAAVEDLARRVETQQAHIAKSGWSTPQSCDVAPERGDEDTSSRPYDVVVPPEQDTTARRVCIHRLTFAKEIFSNRLKDAEKDPALAKKLCSLPVLISDLAKAAESGGMPRLSEKTGLPRKRQASEFLGDLHKFGPTVGRNYLPHIGSASDYLSIGQDGSSAQCRILAKQSSSADEDGITVLGASLDSYFGCVADVREQLTTKYAAWSSETRSAPQRKKQYVQYVMGQCRKAFANLEMLKIQHQQASQQLQALESGKGGASRTSANLLSRRVLLNGEICE